MAGLRLGLRAQILLALLVVFVVSSPLLGVATVRLTQASARVELQRAARAQLAAIALAVERGPRDAASLDRLFGSLSSYLDVRAVRIATGGRIEYARGKAGTGVLLSVPLHDGASLYSWFEEPGALRLSLGNLLLFYVSITGLAVLVLTYFALTVWIVRPLGRLTRFSEHLAAGALDARVPESGAVEVAQLAHAFNRMAAQLRTEQNALVARLRELEQTTSELKSTQEQLIHGERLASVGRLAAGVAHEIGNPLSAILGLVELLRGGELAPESASEFLVRIQAETERIHRIIRDLLDFSRRDLEDDGAVQRADVDAVVEDALKLIRVQRASKHIDIAVDIQPGLRPVVAAPHRLRQVILNLVMNAVDALALGGAVRIAAVADESGCLLSVTDNGPGLAAPVREHLFEPFTTTKPPGKGTGLGLAVCHALVTRMGGTIRAEQPEGGGTRFVVQLRSASMDASET